MLSLLFLNMGKKHALFFSEAIESPPNFQSLEFHPRVLIMVGQNEFVYLPLE